MGDKDLSLYVQLYLQIRSKLEILESRPPGVGSEPTTYFQQMHPTMDWWWPTPPEGYIAPDTYLFLSHMPEQISSPPGEIPIYRASAKNLYSTYRGVLERCPKVDVDPSEEYDSWNTQYQSALTESEKPSSPSEEKPGFVKMTSNAGTIVCDNFVIANGRDWISELKKKAEESAFVVQNTFSPGKDHGVNGIVQNVSFNFSTKSVPSEAMRIPSINDSKSFFAVFTANNEWEKLDIAPYDDIAVSLKLGAVGKVPVQPDPHWYNADFLYVTAKRDSWSPPFTKENIFGENGLLSGMLYSFFATYHVAYNLAMSPDTFQKFAPLFETALGFRIGHFHFGAGNSSSEAGEDVVPKPSTTPAWRHEIHPDTYTFEGDQNMADFPTVIGVDVVRILSPDQELK